MDTSWGWWKGWQEVGCTPLKSPSTSHACGARGATCPRFQRCGDPSLGPRSAQPLRPLEDPSFEMGASSGYYSVVYQHALLFTDNGIGLSCFGPDWT